LDNVAYILGAGFSAPLQIPVTARFMEAASDIHRGGDPKYGYFADVFRLARELSAVKSYLKADLLSIEEILSILQMRNELRGVQDEKMFVRFICDVVSECSPPWVAYTGSVPATWQQLMWGGDNRARAYGRFVGSLFGLALRGGAEGPRSIPGYGCADARYAVITLNYDRALETLCENARQFVGDAGGLAFRMGQEVVDQPYAERPSLIKLHGDVKARNVIPPTWSKSASPEALPVWRQAYAALQMASKIRFLGYSLPEGDFYFRYLVKTAVADGQFLKEIDVICLDPSGDVRSRYEAFVQPERMHFISANVLKYLGELERWDDFGDLIPDAVRDIRPFGHLEDAHAGFMTVAAERRQA